jgi:Domain of unknown function (DUF5666)
MNTHKKSVLRWQLLVSCLAIISLTMACAGVTLGTTSDDVQIEDGVVQVKNENGDWTPVAGAATFELVGELQNMDPWTVAGKTFETNELTQIADGLQVGDLVRVQGTVLEDDTWVAYSIQPAEEQTDPTIVLIGVVDSVDPWVVNGIELNVTDTTEIQGDITPGTIVRVEILLLDDGTWEVLSIAPLGDSTGTPGCATVIATIVSVNGDQVQFLGWPVTVTLQLNTNNENDNENDNNGNEVENGNENANENEQNGDQGENNDEQNEDENESGDAGGVTLEAGQVVLAVVCVSEDGSLVIVSITVLNTDDNDGDNGGTPSNGQEKVLVCHKPNSKKGGHTLSIAKPAVPAHLAHGDTLGPCP